MGGGDAKDAAKLSKAIAECLQKFLKRRLELSLRRLIFNLSSNTVANSGVVDVLLPQKAIHRTSQRVTFYDRPGEESLL